MTTRTPLFVLSVIAAGCSSSKEAPACAIARDPLPDTRLRADGTRFRDALGRIVILRGVDAGGRSKFAPYSPFDYQTGQYDAALSTYLDRAASWGIDVLRVPFTWAAVEPAQGMNDAEFLGRYDALLQQAWARGMWTIVDFHQDIYSEVFCGDGFPGWTVPDPKPMPHHDCPKWSSEYFGDAGVRAAFDRFWASGGAVQQQYQSLWDRMIARYRDMPGVVGFEPINEPGWGTQSIAAFESGTLTDFFAAMVPRVRAAAPGALVFVEPTGYASAANSTTLGRPPGDGVVFAPHYYQPVATVRGGGDDGQVIGGMGHWADVGAAWKTPVFIGEFGIRNDSDNAAEFMSAHFDAFDQLALSGSEWEYSVATEAWNAENFGLVAADGTEYAVAAAIVRPYPRAIAGEDASWSWDASARAFALSYTPSAGGVTEVSLPSRAYPSGFRVAGSAACVDASRPGLLLVRANAGATRVALTIQPSSR
jgi:endoglycosylceramidase